MANQLFNDFQKINPKNARLINRQAKKSLIWQKIYLMCKNVKKNINYVLNRILWTKIYILDLKYQTCDWLTEWLTENMSNVNKFGTETVLFQKESS